MKIKYLVIFCLLVMISNNLFSQENNKNTEQRFTIQTSPLLYAANIVTASFHDKKFFLDLEGQYKISNIFNVSLWAGAYFSNYYGSYTDEFQVDIKPMFIYRPLRTGLKGLYLGLYPTVGWHSYKDDFYKEFSTILGFGLNFGYKWIFKNGFTLQLGSGLGKSWIIPKDHNVLFASDLRVIYKKIDVTIIDFKLGYSF